MTAPRLEGDGVTAVNMLKTVFGSIHSDAAVKEIEALGVAMKQVGKDGKEEWRPIQDVLYDVIAATEGATMSTEELNKAMAGGKFQWAKLSAMMGDLPTILNATALSMNSAGKSHEYVNVQVETLSRRLGQLKASLIGLVSDKASGGFIDTVKEMVRFIDQIVLGLNRIPKEVYGFAALAAGIMALARAYNAASAAVKALDAAQKSAAISAALLKPAMAAVGLAVAALAWYMGNAAQKAADLQAAQERQREAAIQHIGELQQQQGYVKELAHLHDQLTAKLQQGTMADAEAAKVKKDLAAVSDAMKGIIGEEAFAQLEAAHWTEEAVNRIVEAKKQERIVELQTNIDIQTAEREKTQTALEETTKRIEALKKEAEAQIAAAKASEGVPQPVTGGFAGLGALGRLFGRKSVIEKANEDVARAEQDARNLQDKLKQIDTILQDLRNKKAGIDNPLDMGNKDIPNPVTSAKSQLSELTSVYRNALQEMENDAKTYWQGIYKAQEDSLQKQIDALRSESDEEIRIRERVKEIDDELRQEEIAQRRADRQQEIKDAQNQLEELRRKRQAILDDVIVYVKDGQRIRQADQEKLRDIDKQIFDAQRKYDDAIAKDKREAHKEQLQAEKDELEARRERLAAEREAQITALQQELDAMRLSHEQQMKDLDKYWEVRLTEQAVQQDIERMIMLRGYDAALRDYQNYLNKRAEMQKGQSSYQAGSILTNAAPMVVTPPAGALSLKSGGLSLKSLSFGQLPSIPRIAPLSTGSSGAIPDLSGITAALGKLSTANITIDRANITARQVVLAGASGMAQYGYTDR